MTPPASPPIPHPGADIRLLFGPNSVEIPGVATLTGCGVHPLQYKLKRDVKDPTTGKDLTDSDLYVIALSGGKDIDCGVEFILVGRTFGGDSYPPRTTRPSPSSLCRSAPSASISPYE